MKLSDCETAILALSGDMQIIEIKLAEGQVRKAFAVKDNMLIQWDANGRAFRHMLPVECQQACDCDSLEQLSYERDKDLDLKL